MPRRPLSLLALVALGGGLLGAGAPPGGGGAPAAEALATAYERDEDGARRGQITVRDDGARERASTAVWASTEGGEGRAEATAESREVSLFGGLVTAELVEARAEASAGGVRRSGRVTRLRVNGRLRGSPSRPHRYRIGGVGLLEVLASDLEGIVGLRATLDQSIDGYPAGSVVSVAGVSAQATDAPPPEPEPTPEPSRDPEPRRNRDPAPRPSTGDDREPTTTQPDPAPAERRPAPALVRLATTRGYAFPVHGGSTYGDDWGAPRQHTGTHEGNDIFAATGTPVLAVADGTLHRVGTRTVPGNRLWLRGPRGDTFFYAHLSAFAEGASNGARVAAGDVIGFVGSTGDAEQTPPHLHFEIHPGGDEAVNPYPFLRAWESRRDVPEAAWLTRYGADPGSRPGVLVMVEDYLGP